MATFIMLGKYTQDAIKGISPDRTKKAVAAIEKLKGKVNSMHVLMGRYDLLINANFPETKDAMKASIELTKLTGIGFATLPAMTVDEFDKMAG
ncbi:MAG TPA: GYD domain-containing protein [Candidatus Omnitrophota bacterium]|nr:GYD domain-containing protein [Candidatus Omnitrophota bacterium]